VLIINVPIINVPMCQLKRALFCHPREGGDLDEIRRPVLNFEVQDPGRGGTWAGMTIF